MPIDMQPYEHQEALNAGKVGGEYLDSIGVFDLSKLTRAQWQMFLDIVCTTYVERLASRKELDDEIPF